MTGKHKSNKKQTSRMAESAAGCVLRSKRSSKNAKTAAGSALAQMSPRK